MSKLLLIDGHSILNRAYYGVRGLRSSKGVPTNAVYGFLNMMFKYIEEEKPDYITVAFDVSAPTFRHQIFSEYKGTRKPTEEDLKTQVPMIQKMLKAMDITIVKEAGLEADDILGTISRIGESKDMDVTIVSGDRDLLQLATKKVKIAIPKTSKGLTTTYYYYDKDVEEEYGCTPIEFIDMKALMGDTADNIPGVPSIGEKTAKNIISKYKSIEAAFEHADEVKPPNASKKLKEFYDQAVLSKELATIKLDAPVEYDIEQCKYKDIYTEEAYKLCTEWEIKRLLPKFEDKVKQFDEINCSNIFSQSRVEDLMLRLPFEKCVGVSYVKFSEESKDGQMDLFSRDELRLLALSDGRESYCIDLSKDLSEAYVNNVLYDLSLKCDIISFNLKDMLYDFPKLNRDKCYDLSLMCYLNDSTKKEYVYSDIARDYLDMNLPDVEELIGKKDIAVQFDDNKKNIVKLKCLEAFVASKGYATISDKLRKEDNNLYYNIEMPLLYTLYDMEKEGIALDKNVLKEYGESLSVRITELENLIYEMAGEKFNINSPKQLGEILFSEDKLGLKGGKKTKTGYSTSADVLEKLAVENEIVSKILEYRGLAKLHSTYVEGLIKEVANDGRIHCTFQQTVTATGRLSCINPNLQNIPIRTEDGRLIRKAFSPKEGYVFVDADYSQVELRVLAHMSGDEGLIDAFNRGDDIHTSTASKIFDVKPDDVTSIQRRAAKAVNFGIVYGESAYGLSENLNIPVSEAKGYIEDYFRVYPKMKEFLEGLVEEAKETGYACTMLGRRRPVVELESKNFNIRGFGERVAKNMPIQGTAADIIKLAMINVDKRLKADSMKSKLILQVHDELLIEAAKDEEEKIYDILKEEMMNVL
nr:DNA polymerase I [Lachnospiraceae bacterium]